MSKLVSRSILKNEFFNQLSEGKPLMVSPDDAVEISSPELSGIRGGNQKALFSAMKRAQPLSRPEYDNIKLSGRIKSGFDFGFGERGSLNSRFRRAHFSGSTQGGNSLIDNWQDLIDAIRLDLTIQKMANETVRQYLFDVVPMPQADQVIKVQEMFPYAFEFALNNAEGEAVVQGEKRGGQHDTVEMLVYATGFTWTMLAELFDKTFDLSRMNEGVAQAYAAKRDDLAIKPILDATYGDAGTTKHTAAHDDNDLKRQQLLHQTILDAIDELGQRTDPVTERLIPTNNLVLLMSSYDANHFQQVANGLPENMWNQSLFGIPNISRVVAYDDEVTQFDHKKVTYSGVTAGTAYLIAPNRYMKIPVKRGLTMELDQTPNVNTLAREQRAWYFVEGMYNYGIEHFIQKITLPSW